MKALIPKDKKCDVCGGPLRRFMLFYDAATFRGRWAWLCRECFDMWGIGLGQGKGQEYNSDTDEKTRG